MEGRKGIESSLQAIRQGNGLGGQLLFNIGVDPHGLDAFNIPGPGAKGQTVKHVQGFEIRRNFIRPGARKQAGQDQE